MKITKIHLTNVRCCENLKIEFDRPGSSTLLCGDNGDGKSTVLRCIAMGLCDQTSAAGLLRELAGEFVRKGADIATITIELVDAKQISHKIETTIKALKAFESLTQKVYVGGRLSTQQDFPWHDIFVAAYGPGNRITGTADYQHYVAVDAVYSLFKNDVPLQNPELVLRRAIDEARKRFPKDYRRAKQHGEKTLEYLRGLLETLLNLDNKDRLFLSKAGIEIKSRRWGKAELGALGDGYRSTTTWILDLISWWMLMLGKKSYYGNRNIRGIVIIDEVEQHLHPKWQTKIMQLLCDAFDNVQFIATTHSPLVISGCKELPVYILSKGQHKQMNVFGWLAEDVYREVMGLSTSRPFYTAKLIEKYRNLDLKKVQQKATRSELATLKKLKQLLLNELPSNDPIVLTARLANLV